MSEIKNAWIAELTFARTDDGTTYDFRGSNTDITDWNPQLERRGSTRARMQQHGTHPRTSVYGGLTITHEGVFGPADSQTLVVAERDELKAALFGDLSLDPADDLSVGTLTVKYLGWDESASGLVTLDPVPQMGFSRGDVLTLAYQIHWRCDLPYFTGDFSGAPVLL